GQSGRHFDAQVVALAGEGRTGRDPNDQEEVAGRAAEHARPALAGHPHPRPVADAGRDLDLEPARLATALVRELDHARRAVERLLEADVDRLLDVLTAAGRAAARARATAAEQVVDRGAGAGGGRGATAAASA